MDTWGWLSLFDRRESRHEDVSRLFQDLNRAGALIYTTDYVIDETITLLFKRVPRSMAFASYEKLEAAWKGGFLMMEWIDRDRFEGTLALRRRYDDKPDISFTDLSSMVVMQERGIRDVITGDAHFNHVGLGFRRRPIVS